VSGAGPGDEGEDLFAEINVTPLVDVVLVLLLIFMITAPMLTMTMDVDLPEVSTASPASPTAIVITVGREGSIALGDRVLALGDVVDEARRRHDADEGAIYLRADRDVPYHLFVSVLDALRGAGLEEISLVTRPADVAPEPDPRRGPKRR
jgi:biopolymer transport protein TolR